jgi:hypothetical protein
MRKELKPPLSPSSQKIWSSNTKISVSQEIDKAKQHGDIDFYELPYKKLYFYERFAPTKKI